MSLISFQSFLYTIMNDQFIFNKIELICEFVLSLNNHDKFYWILNNEDYKILSIFSTFLKTCFSLRKQYGVQQITNINSVGVVPSHNIILLLNICSNLCLNVYCMFAINLDLLSLYVNCMPLEGPKLVNKMCLQFMFV